MIDKASKKRIADSKVVPLEGFEDTIELSHSEEASVWLSKWLQTVHPYKRYKKWIIKESIEPDTDSGVIFSKLKNYYIKYVLNEEWSEKKFVAVVDELLSDISHYMSPDTFDSLGTMYDEGKLKIQKMADKAKRKKRI